MNLSKEALDKKMRFHVLKAGVKEKLWERILNHKNEQVVLQFLINLERFEWKAVDELWTAPNATEGMWAMMELADEDFTEWVKLKRLRGSLYERVQEFRKNHLCQDQKIK